MNRVWSWNKVKMGTGKQIMAGMVSAALTLVVSWALIALTLVSY